MARNAFGVNVLDVDHDLEVLAYGASDGVMGLVNLMNERPLATLRNGGSPVLAVSIDLVSGETASAIAEGRVVVADTLASEIEHDFHAVKGPIWPIQLKRNGLGFFRAW